MKIILAATALVVTSVSSAFAHSYHLVTPLDSLAQNPAQLELRLQDYQFPTLHAGKFFSSESLTSLVKAYGQRLNLNEAVLSSSNLPDGLSIQNNKLVGTPTTLGSTTFTLTAEARGVSTSRNYTLHTVAVISASAGVRTWSDGSVASSCRGYLAESENYHYTGDSGDGVYRIEPSSGQSLNVFCDMTRDGGGWALVVKQAQGDGATLQGDTAYWTQGLVLNDTAEHWNKNNGNLVSAAFTRLPVTEFRLEAANETEMKYHTRSQGTAHSAFSDGNRVDRRDTYNSTGIQYPNWFIHATHYPSNGHQIGISYFGFNFAQRFQGDNHIICATRWGWTSDDVSSNSQGVHSHDSCGGLGAYGVNYGGGHMLNKHTWQPATLYLWVR